VKYHRANCFVSCTSLVVGALLASYLHGKWFGPWMHQFGNPPATNPSYGFFSTMFEELPYLASGLAAGSISALGRPSIRESPLRLAGPLVLFLLLAMKNLTLALHVHLPAMLAAHSLFGLLLFAYGRLAGTTPQSKT